MHYSFAPPQLRRKRPPAETRCHARRDAAAQAEKKKLKEEQKAAVRRPSSRRTHIHTARVCTLCSRDDESNDQYRSEHHSWSLASWRIADANDKHIASID